MTWTRDKPPPHKHDKPDCPTCLAYRLACIAEDVLNKPFSVTFGAAGKALKPHLALGTWEIERRWTQFVRASVADAFFAKHRTIPYFCSQINCTWTLSGISKRKKLEYE